MFVSDVLGVARLVKGIRSVVEEVVVSTTAIRVVVWARGDACDRIRPSCKRSRCCCWIYDAQDRLILDILQPLMKGLKERNERGRENNNEGKRCIQLASSRV
jgi:hypothetical protein